jgi:hypothetical protein
MVPKGGGGCAFAADPALPATDAQVFWLPDWRPTIVILRAQPEGRRALTFTPSAWADLRVRRSARDGEHIIVGLGREEHQLWLPDPPAEGASLAAIIGLDDYASRRVEAAMGFLRLAKGQRARGDPTKRNCLRAKNILRALDGHLSGASYRVIAEVIFGPSRVAAEPWKTSSVRDAAIRLVRRGVTLMRGGYRNILRRRDFD